MLLFLDYQDVLAENHDTRLLQYFVELIFFSSVDALYVKSLPQQPPSHGNFYAIVNLCFARSPRAKGSNFRTCAIAVCPGFRDSPLMRMRMNRTFTRSSFRMSGKIWVRDYIRVRLKVCLHYYRQLHSGKTSTHALTLRISGSSCHFPRLVLRVVVFEVFKIKRAFKVWVRFPHSPLR